MTPPNLPMKPLTYDDRIDLSGELEDALFYLQTLLDNPIPTRDSFDLAIGNIYRLVAVVMQELIALPDKILVNE